ncbi:MAG: hypothetical protein Tsb002_10100 [Wenzhouxiangellaceae bacterium]
MQLQPSYHELPNQLGVRILQLRSGITQEVYARRLGVHVNTLARYERGERLPDAGFLLRLAATGVNIHWVLTGKGGRYVSDPPANLIRDGDASAAGYASPGDLYAEVVECMVQRDSGDLRARPPVMAFQRQWLTQQFGAEEQDLFLLRVLGDSMNPTLKAGDMVLIDGHQLPDCAGDGLYLLRLGQALMIRRLQTLPAGRYRVISANPDYAAFIIRLGDDEIRVLGRVVWAGQQV